MIFYCCFFPTIKLDGKVIHMSVIVIKIFFDQVPFVSTAYNELIDAVLRYDFHYMPYDGFSTDFHHWFGD